MISTTHTGPGGSRRQQERESQRLLMKRLFLLVFPFCLASTILGRIGRIFGPHEGTTQSAYAEAKASAYAALGYAFHA
ncbi:hypothetical protein E1180_16275 [Roseibium denhamense]|uniref:Uncharacterized protein n=1 Tax=Roseibium denhamense TaxID=76305 RepID=A0ABY1PKU8_9HYPH|nr:hypothetical protein [Roseibium denhamense]MTI07068.1 hypothetical protein [Roseibium denhamense]SMP36429.1 hypothetical protein SAMN06265374_4146 [Roseibium denhamense]